MIMCVLLCYPVSIRIYYQQGGLFLVMYCFTLFELVYTYYSVSPKYLVRVCYYKVFIYVFVLETTTFYNEIIDKLIISKFNIFIYIY